MKHNVVRGLSALVVATGLASASIGALAQQGQPAQPAPPGANPSAAALPASDADFVRLFADVGNSEVVLARYMLRNTQNPVVRNFAQQMIDDHQSGNVSLRSTVRANGDRYGQPLDRVLRATVPELERLQSLSGPQLDRAYMQMQAGMHRRALAITNWEATNGKDSALKNFAASQLPALTMHAEMAGAYLATNGQSTVIDAGGGLLGATSPGMRMPATAAAANAPAANNPRATSNGGTRGTENSSGGSANGNPLNNAQGGTPSLGQSTPAPGASTSPSPGASGSPSPGASGAPSPGPSGSPAPAGSASPRPSASPMP